MSLIIELKYDPISKSITYKINDGEEKRFLDGPGNKSDFTDDLKEIIPNYADFMIVYNAYKNQHSFTGNVSSALSSMPSMSPNPMKWGIFNRSKKSDATVYPETSQPNAEQTTRNLNIERVRKGLNNIGGKKTKSRRSHNANKTLKNRK
jgi:hypothetical protein